MSIVSIFIFMDRKKLTVFVQNFQIEKKNMSLKFNSTVSVLNSDNTIILLNLTKSLVPETSFWHRILISIHLYSMCGSRGGQGVPPPEKSQKYGVS